MIIREWSALRSRRSIVGCLLYLVAMIAPAIAAAQDPSRQYLTIETRHFHISFTRPLEPLARRVAANAERAYTQLGDEMHPPRGPIDILVSDHADYSNGSAITYPTNRIIVYATPPVNEMALRYTTDWAQLVVTHELAHIFHLDRSRGIWRLGQYVFGRSPFLFPNLYQPSWLIEGLAVYEESRLAGQGRIEGPEHTLIARAAALDHVFPSIGQASLAYPRFPLGEAAYAYGSLFIDYLARTRGRDKIRNFVESSSAQLVPYLVDVPARSAFGTSFNGAWNEWRQAIEKTVPSAPSQPMPGWRDLTTDGLVASFPRWLSDSTLTYAGTGGRESYAAFTVSLDGTRKRMARRNGASPTVKLPDGSLLFAQYELTSPYEYRSDLFVQQGRSQRRLTRNQRLFGPDTRSDGAIIATQIVAGSSRLVRVSPDGATILPITTSSMDTLWSEPRWSHRGTHIVTTRWIRGGVSQIVVIDTLGAPQVVVTSGKFIAATPSWIPGDGGVVYTLGQTGATDVYVTHFHAVQDRTVAGVVPNFMGFNALRSMQLSRSDAGLFEPELSAPRDTSGIVIAGITLRGNGYRLGVAKCCDPGSPAITMLDFSPDPRLPVLAVDSSPAKKYSARRQLWPRYWVPLAEGGMDDATYRLGGYTEAWDILRRHYLYGEARIPTDNSGIVAAAQYQFKGFGLPIVSVEASQDWTRFRTFVSRTNPADTLGKVRRRVRDGELLATFLRKRVRSSFSVSLGAGVERREYVSLPATLLPAIDPGTTYIPANFPRITLASGYAKYLTPPFAISPEDGFSVGVTARERIKSGFNATGGSSLTVVSSVSAYKSLDFPGFAHHVLAVRASGGWADTKTNGYFEAGGTSGGTFQIIPGYTIGEGRQTFPVRGFLPGTLIGIRAASASAEYRAPLSARHATVGTLPAFLQRSALTFFGDYGIAWCPNTSTARQVCVDPSQEVRADAASIGAEVSVNAGLLSWDSPYRFRLGGAVPIHNRQPLGAKRATVYFASGISF